MGLLDNNQVKSLLGKSQTRLWRRRDVAGIGAVMLTRMWPEVGRTDLDRCLTWLRENPTWMGQDAQGNDTTSNPRIELQEFAGNYYGGVPYLDWEQSDPETPQTGKRLCLFQDLYLLNLTGPSTVTGDSCQFKITEYTVYFQSEPPSVANLHTPGIKWEVSSPVIDMQSGLYTATIRKIERQEQEYEFESEDNAGATERTHVKLGTTDAIQELTPGDGELKTQQVEKNDDCTNNERVQTKTAVNQHGSAQEIRADQTSATEINTQAGSELSPSAGSGQIVQGRSVPTPFKNRWETTLETTTAIDQTITDEEVRADEERTSTTHTQATDAITTPPVPSGGETRQATNQPTQFKDRWRTTLEVRTAIDQTITDEEVRQDQTRTATTHTQAAAAITTPPVPLSGEMRQATNQPTAFKDRWRTTLDVRTAVDQTVTDEDVQADVATSRTTHTFNASTLTTPPVPSDGQQARAINKPTPFKDRTETTAETRTITDQQGSASEERADQTSATETHTAAGSPLVVPAAGSGQQVRGASRPTPFKNRHATELETVTAIDQTTNAADVQADRSVATTIHTQNSSTVTVPPTPGDGESRAASNRPTAFKNRWETNERTATAVKLETDKTYIDANGVNRFYEGVNLQESDLNSKLASINPDNDAVATPNRSREFNNRWDLTIRETPSNTRPTTTAEYDAIGEFIEPWQDRDTGDEFARVTFYTSSKTNAQNYAVGAYGGSSLYGTLALLNAATVTGIKTAWTTSRVVDSQVYRNRGTGRYVAMRVQKKLT